jgi:hypothetical protein
VTGGNGVPLRVRRLALTAALIAAALITLGPLPVSLLDATHSVARDVAALLPGVPADRPRRVEVEVSLNIVVPAVAVVLASWAFPMVRPLLLGAVAAAASCAIETVQLTLPGRHPETRDILLNTVGAAAGAVVATLLFRRNQRQESS